MTPDTRVRVERRIKENERVLRRAEQAEARLNRTVRESERRSAQNERALRRAGVLR